MIKHNFSLLIPILSLLFSFDDFIDFTMSYQNTNHKKFHYHYNIAKVI